MIRKTILLIESDLTVALDLQRRLTALGFRVPAVAASARQALFLAETLHPDLALIDLQLDGDVDAIATSRRLRALHGIPVVYLTGDADVATIARARDSEPVAYLPKTVGDELLRAVVQLALYRRETARRLHEWQSNRAVISLS